MYDRSEKKAWSQMMEGVSGQPRIVANAAHGLTTWKEWQAKHPEPVCNRDLGFQKTIAESLRQLLQATWLMFPAVPQRTSYCTLGRYDSIVVPASYFRGKSGCSRSSSMQQVALTLPPIRCKCRWRRRQWANLLACLVCLSSINKDFPKINCWMVRNRREATRYYHIPSCQSPGGAFRRS